MKLTIEIEGSLGEGKTRLAQFLENKLKEGYSLKFVKLKTKSCPPREIYHYNISML